MEEKILEQLSDIRPEFDFSDSSNFIADGLLDSFDMVQLVTALDSIYKISIDGTDILPENFSSVERISEILIKNGAVR
jgi:acyl carrier protein